MDIIIKSYHPWSRNSIVETLIKNQKLFTFEIRSAFLFEKCCQMKYLNVFVIFISIYWMLFLPLFDFTAFRQWNKLISILIFISGFGQRSRLWCQCNGQLYTWRWLQKDDRIWSKTYYRRYLHQRHFGFRNTKFLWISNYCNRSR